MVVAPLEPYQRLIYLPGFTLEKDAPCMRILKFMKMYQKKAHPKQLTTLIHSRNKQEHWSTMIMESFLKQDSLA
jgi:hypothetical protein